MDFSSWEAKFVDASYAACEEAWIKILVEELKTMEPKKMKLFFL